MAIGLGAYYWQSHRNPQPSSSLTSQHKTIELKNIAAIQEVKEGTQLAGIYHTAKDQSLFYTLSHNQKLVAAGSILPDEKGEFSRNIVMNDKVAAGTALSLKLYTQDTKGKVLDEITTQVVYKQ